MILKVLCVLLLLILVFLWWKHQLIERLKKDMQAGANRHPHTAPPAHREEKMVRCIKCGVFLPVSEALFRDGKFYCCEEHAKSR